MCGSPEFLIGKNVEVNFSDFQKYGSIFKSNTNVKAVTSGGRHCHSYFDGWVIRPSGRVGSYD